MKPAYRTVRLPLLILACLVASSCAATKPPTTLPPPSPHEQALIDILSAQSYAAEIANLAGAARAIGEANPDAPDAISEAAYRSITASGMALDAAWRAATQALMAGTGDLQQRLNVMAEARRNLEGVWKLATGPAIEIPGR